ncbi:uncharacterized protein LOC133791882 isoform X2 [Humulus lupulus]|uniref:uncharacterized protein LOC133791882 isoform X2 n=1 Tax=Humulus lupulus TaxID=3486 RepID=UPI002B4175E3|nr:uncharacterized protein LOC133791882 isoform X2 [Humulus lupulus]
MAVVDHHQDSNRFANKKRKRDYCTRKLLVNDQVEVRSVEDGFFGSWHSGSVIACGSCRRHYRHVRYYHLLADDGSGKLVDMVTVSPILNGIDLDKRDLNESYRGNIRPLPPVVKFKPWGLHYGFCVDAYYNDAWWEGVIFDHDDYSPERIVFFPDLGDEMRMDIGSLRVTLVWNEVTGHWKERGDWIFLELIEEVEKESRLPVSVKQIWYDMREKKDFQKAKEWTCTDKELWNKMFWEVIEDYTGIIEKQHCPTLGLSENLLPIDMDKLESAEPDKDIIMNPQAEQIGSDDVLPVNTPVNSDVVIYQGAIVMPRLDSAQLGTEFTDVNVDPEAVLICSNDVSPVDNSINKDGVVCQEESVKCALESAQAGRDVNMDSEAEMTGSYTTVPVDKLLNSEMVADVIDVNSCIDKINYLQMCDDTAPSAVSMEPDMDQSTSMVNIDESNMNILADPSISHYSEAFCMLPQALPMTPFYHGGISSAGSNSCGVKGNGKCKNQARVSTVNWLPFSSDMIQGAEFCPKAVDEYYDLRCKESGKEKKINSIKISVWKHLLYLGWKCETSHKDVTRRRYTSPDKRCFYSLFAVCKHLKESTRDTTSQDEPKGEHSLIDSCPCLKQSEDSQSPEFYPHTAEFPCCIEDNKPDFGFQSVMQYYLNSYKKDHKRKAEELSNSKKYLFSVGWKVEKHRYGSGRKIVKYRSPTGKTYWSFLTACKACLAEELSRDAASACRLATSLNDTGENEGCSTFSNVSSPMISDMAFQQNLVQQNIPPQKLSSESHSVAGFKKIIKNGEVKVKRIRKTQRKRNGDLVGDVHAFQRQISLHQRRDGLKNCPKKDGKLSHSTYRNSSHLKVKQSKKSKASINLRNVEDGTKPKRVLRSSKRVQEVVIPNSSHHNPRTVLSWLIDNNMVLPRAKVKYRTSKDQRTMAEGRITRNGIKCSCCQKLFTLASFEVHARSKHNIPAANIFLEDGRSLLDCQRQVINNCEMQNSTTELHDREKSNWQRGENDYICTVCHYGGELMLCDRCPSSFHKGCLGLKDIPDGDWFCPSCCCGICREGKFQDQEDKAHVQEGNLICSQCERKYHAGCMNSNQLDKLETCHAGNWFCSEECEKIFLGLQKLLGKTFTVGKDNLTWCLLKARKTDGDSSTDSIDMDALTESYSKLNVALGVMHECFEPVKEPLTRRDLVEDILFNRGSDLKRLNFEGFYTVLLLRNDELITVATVRVYGRKVAEVPLVGTRFQYRRLGMCRIMMNELEKKLMELGVERLVLPAVPSVLNTWTTSFGFSKMTASERLQFLDYTFLDFQDTVMCQKLLWSVPSAGLITLKGLQSNFHDDIIEAGNNIDCDRLSAVSEVYQAEQIEDNHQIVDEGQLQPKEDFFNAKRFFKCD